VLVRSDLVDQGWFVETDRLGALFEPPAAGQLFLRCTDAWTELGDNDGEVTVTIRRAP
jgi:hypothetical protein